MSGESWGPSGEGRLWGQRILGKPTSPILLKATTLRCPSHRVGFGHWSAAQRLARLLPCTGGCGHHNKILAQHLGVTLPGTSHSRRAPCTGPVDRAGKAQVAAPQPAGKSGPKRIIHPPLARSSWLTVLTPRNTPNALAQETAHSPAQPSAKASSDRQVPRTDRKLGGEPPAQADPAGPTQAGHTAAPGRGEGQPYLHCPLWSRCGKHSAPP